MSDDFLWGFCLAAFLWSVLHWWLMAGYQSRLSMKALTQDRVPEWLSDGFYYVVPEAEYNDMERMRSWYQNPLRSNDTTSGTP